MKTDNTSNRRHALKTIGGLGASAALMTLSVKDVF